MSYKPDFRQFLHPAIAANWLGFKSSLGQLAQHGWEFEVLKDIRDYQVQLGIRHPQFKIVGMSNYIDETHLLDLQRYTSDDNFMMHMKNREGYPTQFRGWDLNLHFSVAEKHVIRGPATMSIHTTPVQVGEVIGDHVFVYEPYVKQGEEPEQIVVMPDDVGTLLARIQELQAPRAKEILAQQRKSNELKELSMKAKILTFGEKA